MLTRRWQPGGRAGEGQQRDARVTLSALGAPGTGGGLASRWLCHPFRGKANHGV